MGFRRARRHSLFHGFILLSFVSIAAMAFCWMGYSRLVFQK
jgi:hypothetical protein